MNSYKIDFSRYGSDTYPYALLCRRAWWRRWEHISSFRTKEEALELFAKLNGLPEYLPALSASEREP